MCIRVISLGPRSNVAYLFVKFLSFSSLSFPHLLIYVLTFDSTVPQWHCANSSRPDEAWRKSFGNFFFFVPFARIPLPTGAGVLSVQQSLRMVA